MAFSLIYKYWQNLAYVFQDDIFLIYQIKMIIHVFINCALHLINGFWPPVFACLSHNVPVITITICMYFLQTACLVFNPIMVEIKVMLHSSVAL